MNGPFNFEKYKREGGVYILSEINDEFESSYIKVREKEKRIYSDEGLKCLPFASEDNLHKSEWKLRTKSFLRFKNYLGTKNRNLYILDLGCGNGWFSGKLSNLFNNNFYCVDVNLTELKQGRRVFNSNKIDFIYSDILAAEFPANFFDIILVNAAIQYFPDLKKLIDKLLTLINVNGEIHIMDSPFYVEKEAILAKKRTSDYYNSIGFPEMVDKYFHHTYDNLSSFNYRVLYNPRSLKTKLYHLFLGNDSPFPWIIINK